jgi:hypothetical protein
VTSHETGSRCEFRGGSLKQASRASFVPDALKQAPRASFTLRAIGKIAWSATLFSRARARHRAPASKTRASETGFQSPFQGNWHDLQFYFGRRQKKKLTRLREANIYNNMLCINKTSTQE